MLNKKSSLTYRWFEEVWNQSIESSIDKFVDDNAIVHGIEVSQPGPDGFRSFYYAFRQEFKNIYVDVQEVYKEDDVESARCRVTAIHIPTGKQVDFTGMTIIRTKNDRIVEAWNNFDFLAMNQQLGMSLVQAATEVV